MFDEAMEAWGSAHDWTYEELFEFHLRFKATYDYFRSRGRIVHPLPLRETMSRKAMSGVLIRILTELFALHRFVPLPPGPCVGNTISGRCLRINWTLYGKALERVVQCTTCKTYFHRAPIRGSRLSFTPWRVLSEQEFSVLHVMIS